MSACGGGHDGPTHLSSQQPTRLWLCRYPKYNVVSKKLYRRLQALGAHMLLPVSRALLFGCVCGVCVFGGGEEAACLAPHPLTGPPVAPCP